MSHSPAPREAPRDLPDLLTVDQVAAWLQVHHRTVRTWQMQGSLAHVKVGSRVRFRRDVVEDFIAGRSRTTSSTHESPTRTTA